MNMMTMKTVMILIFILLIVHSLGFIYKSYLQVEKSRKSLYDANNSNVDHLLKKTYEQFSLMKE